MFACAFFLLWSLELGSKGHSWSSSWRDSFITLLYKSFNYQNLKQYIIIYTKRVGHIVSVRVLVPVSVSWCRCHSVSVRLVFCFSYLWRQSTLSLYSRSFVCRFYSHLLFLLSSWSSSGNSSTMGSSRFFSPWPLRFVSDSSFKSLSYLLENKTARV